MLMILARLVRSESFWAVVKVRSPHTGPGIRYIQKMSGIDEFGRCPCLPFIRQSGTYAAPGKGRARSSTEPRAPNDPGGE